MQINIYNLYIDLTSRIANVFEQVKVGFERKQNEISFTILFLSKNFPFPFIFVEATFRFIRPGPFFLLEKFSFSRHEITVAFPFYAL
jgi:hypothetical protein